jgi:hypothetical protein
VRNTSKGNKSAKGIIKKKYKNWIVKQEKCQQSMDSITQEQTLIAYMFPEKREEDD